ncbi:MAG: hypothetical protein L3K26_07025 [Candidatus Hydrogenedentes bacterium]|nr:hypothetical protein [Candidatus Hydrogenedentota bacterium]
MQADSHTLMLTPKEREEVLKNLSLPNGIAARFRFALHQGDLLEISLSEAELEAFLTHLSDAMSETEDEAFVSAVAGITERNTPWEPGGDFEIDRDMFPEELPEELFEKIQALLKEGDFRSPEEAFAAVQELVMAYVDIPIEDYFHGLSQDEAYRLIDGPWDKGDSVLRLSADLSVDDLAGSAMANSGRRFLAAVAEEEPIRLTASKNMNRKSLLRITEATAWPELDLEKFLEFTKQPNERDILPIHVLRILLEIAGYLKLQKGKMTITKAGRAALDLSRAGEIQVRLFTALCRKYNLGYNDRLPEYPAVQETYPYILYVLSQVGKEPMTREALCECLFLEGLREDFFENEYICHDRFVLSSRIINPLIDFGLLSPKYGPSSHGGRGKELHTVQTTPLFYKMIDFVF